MNIEPPLENVKPHSIFITNNDTIYVTDWSSHTIHFWSITSPLPKQTMQNTGNNPKGLFVTTDGTIYVATDDGNSLKISRSKDNFQDYGEQPGGRCNRLFIDTENYLYCSITDAHKVVKSPLHNPSNSWILAAGGNKGSGSDQLNEPHGIFVDLDLNLFVADKMNDRIQKYECNVTNGTTVAGNGISSSLSLTRPTAIAQDVDDHLFILHEGPCAIVQLVHGSLQCVIQPNSSSLGTPRTSFAFDTDGNIFAVIQEKLYKFNLVLNDCGRSFVCEYPLYRFRCHLGEMYRCGDRE